MVSMCTIKIQKLQEKFLINKIPASSATEI